MADKYLNNTGLTYYHNRLKTIFADKGEFDTLSDKVDELIAEGGEPNVIEIVKVNNTPLTPDQNKAVNVEVPEDLSDLTNTGADPYATESYVDQNGGKIDVIKVNGTAQTITNKEVDLTVPTKVSDLTNDSNFQTDSDVSSAISTALANSGDAYQTESDVDGKIASAVTSVYKYKGSVATYNDLPASGNTTGDVWDVQATGLNYAWNGTGWDGLGQYVDTSTFWTSTSGQSNSLIAITTSEIDTIVGA